MMQDSSETNSRLFPRYGLHPDKTVARGKTVAHSSCLSCIQIYRTRRLVRRYRRRWQPSRIQRNLYNNNNRELPGVFSECLCSPPGSISGSVFQARGKKCSQSNHQDSFGCTVSPDMAELPHTYTHAHIPSHPHTHTHTITHP